MAFSRSCIHCGLGPFFTPLITRPKKTGHCPSASSSILTVMGQANSPFTAVTSCGFKRPSPRAARSRAMPRTPSASGRLGVMAISITVSTLAGSLAASQSVNRAPTSPDGSSIMPSCSSESSISRSEHIMPKLSMPRIFPTPMVVSIPGT